MRLDVGRASRRRRFASVALVAAVTAACARTVTFTPSAPWSMAGTGETNGVTWELFHTTAGHDDCLSLRTANPPTYEEGGYPPKMKFEGLVLHCGRAAGSGTPRVLGTIGSGVNMFAITQFPYNVYVGTVASGAVLHVAASGGVEYRATVIAEYWVAFLPQGDAIVSADVSINGKATHCARDAAKQEEFTC